MSFRHPEGSRYDRGRRDTRYDYNDRRDGERDPRDRTDRDRPRDHFRERSRSRSRDRDGRYTERERDRWVERDGDQSRGGRTEASKPPTGPRDPGPRHLHRGFSSPLNSKSNNTTDPRLERGPETSPGKPTILSTPVSSTPPTPNSSADSSSASGKITAALRQLSQRSNEQGALQLRKDVVEARARAREREHVQSHPKYAEFPSLKDYHRKLEKKDIEDLDALRKEVNAADKQWLASAEAFASTLLQAFAELQHEKDRRIVTPVANDGLEARINSRLDAFEKQRKEEAERHEKQIQELQRGLSTEIAQRKIVGIENESLKKKVQDLEHQNQSLAALVGEHENSIKQLHEQRPSSLPTQAPHQDILAAENLTDVKVAMEECQDRIAYLQGIVSEHDKKLGEMDIDLIGDSCSAIATTVPRLEQTIKRAADDITLLRSDNGKLQTNAELLQSSAKQLQLITDQLQLDTQKLHSDIEKLRSSAEQLRSDSDLLQSNTEQLKSDNEQLKSGNEQLKSETAQLRLDAEKLQSVVQRPPEADTFITVKQFSSMNEAVFKTFGGWIEDLKKRMNAVEGQDPTLQAILKQQNDVSSQIKVVEDEIKILKNTSDQRATRRVPTPAVDPKTIQLEGKWKDHDKRLKALEAVSRPSLQQSEGTHEEPADAADSLALKRASVESMKAAITALKTQVAMIDQSVKAVSESAKLTNESQAAQIGRIGELEAKLAGSNMRLGTAEQNMRLNEERLAKSLEFMQHNFTSLDSQMNNLTTESLFQAIVHHIDNYHPTEALVGPKVDKMVQQMNVYEQRLVALERTVDSGEEPANKKRKLSPRHRPAFPIWKEREGMSNGVGAVP
ncbi:hypothetical protein EsH8_II_000764 [Colletotrichum jinshuiense]